jgi:hypothetical protein
MAGRSVILIALAGTLTAVGALAADPPAQPEKQRLICRGGERQLGSHVRARQRCRTAEQWQDEDEAKSRLPTSLQVTQGQNDGRASAGPR